MIRWLAALGAALALALFGAIALAQDTNASPADPNLAEAWTHDFNEAVARMADGAFDDAADLFEHAYAESHRVEALFNQGLALARAGRHAAAYDVFARVVTEHAHELDAPAIEDVVARRAAEAGQTGLLRVTTDGVRGAVLVDGQAIGTVERDADVELRVNAGTHRVALRTADDAAAEEERGDRRACGRERGDEVRGACAGPALAGDHTRSGARPARGARVGRAQHGSARHRDRGRRGARRWRRRGRSLGGQPISGSVHERAVRLRRASAVALSGSSQSTSRTPVALYTVSTTR